LALGLSDIPTSSSADISMHTIWSFDLRLDAILFSSKPLASSPPWDPKHVKFQEEAQGSLVKPMMMMRWSFVEVLGVGRK